MPLVVEGVGPVASAAVTHGHGGASASVATVSRGRLDIGLVNNMPDGALEATERQFARLLAAVSGTRDVRLHLFSLKEIPRGSVARSYLAGRYGDLQALEGARLDGLIVTGAEPAAESLTEEPYWQALTRVIDWAEHNTASTVFSCLAAHAAVLHLDGIARRRLTPKRFGLFECVKVSANTLFDGAPSRMRMPHSRWNDLAEGDLRSHGYSIASRSMEAGIDAFTKPWASLFVFLQGHPEYDADTLGREFRRDMRRFLEGGREDAPLLPTEYFDEPTEELMARFRHQALRNRDVAIWDAFPKAWTVRSALLQAWQATSHQLFGNWLNLVAETSQHDLARGRTSEPSR